MKTLIRFWSVKLQQHRWLMSREDREMVAETIRCLREMQRYASLSRVEREAEIVRTVKELSIAKEVTE